MHNSNNIHIFVLKVFYILRIMKKLVSLFATILALVAVACGGDDDVKPTPKPTPDVQDPNAPFYVEFAEITRGSVTFNVTPKDFEMDYICMVYDKETVEDYTRDKYLVERVFDDLEILAEKQYKTLDEYFPYIRQRSVSDDIKFSGLSLDTKHYVVIFGVTQDAKGYKGYKSCTDVVKVSFTTLDVEMSDATYRVEPYVSYNNVSLDVYPSDKEQLWYLCTMKKSEYDAYVGDGKMEQGAFYRKYFQQEVNTVGADVIHSGELRIGAPGLAEHTTYCYLIAGLIIDKDGIVIVTDVFYGEYTTEEAEPSDMYFDIEIRDVQQMSVAYSVTRHNPDEVGTYICLIEPWDGVSTADEVMRRIVNHWKSKGALETMLTDKGKIEHLSKPKSLPAAGQKYYIIAFGYAGGITTEAFMKTFETPAGGSVEDVEFSVSATSITPYGFTLNVQSTDSTIYYAPGACKAADYNEAGFIEAVNYDFDYYLNGSRDWNPYYTVAETLDQYYYNGNNVLTLSGLESGTEYMVYIYAMDIKTGHVVKCFTFDAVACTTTVGEVVPTIKLVGIYSGEEENGSIFEQPELTKGKAIVVFEYAGLENATTLHATLIDIDASNIIEYPDANLWGLVPVWTECSLDKPYTFWAPIEWNQVYTALAYAKDQDGNNGKFARMVIKPELSEKDDIAELRELYNELYPKEEATRGALPASLVVPAAL